jgi:putative tricarboxylic transport membrane protein
MRVPQDVWIGLVMLGAAVAYWYGADGIPISPLDGAVNAAAMPKALAYALGALSLLLIVRALSVEVMAQRAAASAGVDAAPAAPLPTPEQLAKRRHAHLRAAGMLAFGVAYLLVLYLLGYLISAALLIIGVAIYNGAKPDWRLGLTALGLAIGFHVVFVVLLGIPLPPGLLAGLLG